MLTFSKAWLEQRGVHAVLSVPFPGQPMILVQHKIEGVAYEFLAKIPRPADPITPEKILAAAERQIEEGIAERRRLLAAARSEAQGAVPEEPAAD